MYIKHSIGIRTIFTASNMTVFWTHFNNRQKKVANLTKDGTELYESMKTTTQGKTIHILTAN